MKLKKAMMSLAAATAAGLCISAYAANSEKGQSGKLNLTDYATQFTETAADPSPSGTSGTPRWNTVPAVETISETPWFVIDCDAASSNEFEVAATTGDVVQCDFDLQVAPVPLSLRPESASGAQTAFCVCVDGAATNFCAYVSGGWTNLVGGMGFAVPAADTDYSLRVTFDYKNGKYVKFSVKTSGSTYTDLYDAAGSATDKWFVTASSNTGVSQYCFVGTGNVKSFTTAQANVVAEDASVTPPGGSGSVTIEIPEEALALVSGASTSEKAAALMAPGSNSQPKLSNYILFGLDSNGAIKEEAKTVSKIDTVVDGSGNIPLSFDNLKVQTVGGTTVRYTLLGKKSYEAVDYDTLVAATTDEKAMKITPANITAGYKFFKVSVDVSYDGK